jgi:dolichol kinase
MALPENLQLSPLHRNIGVCMAMVFYYKIVTEFVCWTRVKWQHPYSRQILHLFFSSLVIFWPYFDRIDWSWRLNALVPFVVWTRLVYKGAILRDPGDPDVQNMSSSSTPHDLLFGPAWAAAVMVWIGIYSFMSEEAAVVAAVSLGDGLAPLIGKKYGRHLFHFPLAKPKTIEGSVVGVFLGAVAGCYFYLYMMGLPVLPLRLVLAYSGIAAVAEATAPGNLDNIVAPVILHLSFEQVQEYLPA